MRRWLIGAAFLGALAASLLGLVLESRAQLTPQVQRGVQCNKASDAPAGFTTKVQVIAAPSTSQSIYVCGYTVSAVAAANITFQSGTGTNCATGSTATGPKIQLGATATFADPAGYWRGWTVGPGVALCATASAAADLEIYYAVF